MLRDVMHFNNYFENLFYIESQDILAEFGFKKRKIGEYL